MSSDNVTTTMSSSRKRKRCLPPSFATYCLPAEIWLKILIYATSCNSNHLHFSLKLLKICKLWRNIILINMYTPLLPTITRKEWMKTLKDGTDVALSRLRSCEYVGGHSYDLIQVIDLERLFERLFISLRLRVLSFILYEDMSNIAPISISKTKAFMHRHHACCSFRTMSTELLETVVVREYVKRSLQYMLQDVWRQLCVKIEEYFFASPNFNGLLLVDNRMSHRRPWIERKNCIDTFSMLVVDIIQDLANSVSPLILDAFSRGRYLPLAKRKIVHFLLKNDNADGIQCYLCTGITLPHPLVEDDDDDYDVNLDVDEFVF